uniref:Uncharacterized protein n=1 Tax=Cacopsylla melanoneura TaxID=428564 RepID=A0A8D8TT47_9HEMI
MTMLWKSETVQRFLEPVGQPVTTTDPEIITKLTARKIDMIFWTRFGTRGLEDLTDELVRVLETFGIHQLPERNHIILNLLDILMTKYVRVSSQIIGQRSLAER